MLCGGLSALLRRTAVKHDDLVFEALTYRRNLGADLTSIRAYVKFRETRKRSTKNDQAALTRLEKAGKITQVGQKWFLTRKGLKLARGPAMKPEWQPGDTCILLAILLYHGKDGSDLEDIIGAVDYIDRSYPTLEEMHGALNRLVAGGLVKTRRGLYLATDKAAGIFAKVKACCRRGVRSQVRGLDGILDCPCCGVTLKKVRWRIVIDDAALKEAIRQYIGKA
jgi:hypothetical protein